MHLCLHRRLDIAYRRVAQKDITYLRAEQAGAVRACHAGQPQQLEPPLNQIGARPFPLFPQPRISSYAFNLFTSQDPLTPDTRSAANPQNPPQAIRQLQETSESISQPPGPTGLINTSVHCVQPQTNKNASSRERGVLPCRNDTSFVTLPVYNPKSPSQPPASTPKSTPPPLFSKVPPNQLVEVELNLKSLGSVIPQSFMGISHEWPHVDELNRPEYFDIFKRLQSYGSGPLVLRIGGGSSDLQTFVPPDSVWKALTNLHLQTGILFIIGLNFELGDTNLAKGQMDAAKAGLPANSIIGFEIGNEVRSIQPLFMYSSSFMHFSPPWWPLFMHEDGA
eukprot:jgi/Chrzof1/4885/Cz15g03040.t1